MIRVGVFGAGRMAQDHISNIQQSQIAKAAWIVDPNKEVGAAAASQFNTTHFERAEDALARASDVDAFVIVSPSATHLQIIQMLLELNKPIFCEKPIAVATEQVRACIDMLKRRPVPFLLGFNRRFDRSISTLRARIGEVGSIHTIDITSRDHPCPPLAYLRTSGGMFYDMTIHDFDMARWLLGEDVCEVYATGSTLILPELAQFNDIDTSVCVLKTKSGKMVNIQNSRFAAFGYDQRIQVFGNKGLLSSENLRPTTVQFLGEKATHIDNPYPSFPTRYAEAYRQEMLHFLKDVVRDKKEPSVSAIDGLWANLIADAATRSLKSGRSEQLDPL